MRKYKLITASVITLLGACSFSGITSIDSGVLDADRPDGTVGPTTFRRVIEINPPANMTGSVDSVPIAIELKNDSDFGAAVEKNGNDLLVTDAAGTVLPVEIESIDKPGGTAVIWVLVPTIASSITTSITLHYGTRSLLPPRKSPWHGGTDLVWHFDDIHIDAVGNRTVTDRSPSGFTGTADDKGVLQLTDGIFGKAARINGASIQLADEKSLNRDENDSFTLSLWFKQNSANGPEDKVFYNGGPANPVTTGYYIALGSGAWEAAVRDDFGVVRNRTASFGDGDTLGPQGWHHLVMVLDRTGNGTLRAFIDGALNDSISLDDGIGALANTVKARVGGNATFIDGTVDEVRSMPRAVSADWVMLTHANGSDTNFITIGPHQPAPYPEL